MTLSRWAIGLGLVVGIGMLITGQQISVFIEGYVVGQRMRQVHQEEAALGWVSHEVAGASSPASLARDGDVRRLNLVASSSLRDLSVQSASADAVAEPPPASLARDTSD